MKRNKSFVACFDPFLLHVIDINVSFGGHYVCRVQFAEKERERASEKEDRERIRCNILLGQNLYEEANLLSLQDMHETKQGTLFLYIR